MTLFQFHYGSIKSQRVSVGDSFIPKFQFHYGSIKSIKKC